VNGGPLTDDSHRSQKRLIDAAWHQVERARTTQAASASSAARRRPGDAAMPPGTLPGYQIVEEIHRGGQGVVYRGVQQSTGRTVAVKVMLGGPFAGPKEHARFDREVQILAQLKHPNIVTIHDSGRADGAAYFVMNFIDGEPLDAYVKTNALDVRQRLRLFATVCDAVNAAHLHGVIHRDLKPGNIRIDPGGEPHVLDFGLAKHSQWDATTPQTVTVTGQFVGSLPWASPEQAKGLHDEVDLRTDVYSLGVMLYQLITGSFPYDVTGSLTETADNIVNRDPKNPRSLNARLDDEIATIALKALRKDPELRYQTAGALGSDIERYLTGEPIEAKRDSMTYIIRKHLLRHKLTVGVVAAFALTVTIGFVVSLAFWRQAALARDAEARQKSAAQRNAALAEKRAEIAAIESAKAEAVTKFLTDMLASASPARGVGAGVTVRKALDIAAQRVESGTFDGEPDLEASLRRVIGETYGSLGAYDESIHHLQKAREIHQRWDEAPADALNYDVDLAEAYLAKADLAQAEALFKNTLDRAREIPDGSAEVVAGCLNGLARVHRERDDFDAAERLHREALDFLRQAESEHEAEIATTLNDLGLVLDRKGALDEALSVQSEALPMFRRAYGTHHHHTAVSMSNLAGLYADKGQFAEAEALYQEALAVFREVGGPTHPSVASCLGSLGRLYSQQKKLTEAERCHREALDIRREVLGEDHPLIVNSLNNLATVLYHKGDLDGAEQAFREALALFKKTRGEHHPSVATIAGNIAGVLRVKGDYEAAVPLLRESLAVSRKHLGDDHPLVLNARHNLGTALLETDRLEEAEPLLRDAATSRREVLGDDHPDVAVSLDVLADLLRRKGAIDEAESLCREALEIRRSAFGDEHPDVAGSLDSLAQILTAAGRFDEADAASTEALRIAEKTLSSHHWELAEIRANRGEVLFKLGRLEQAESHLLESYEVLSENRGPNHPATRRTAETLAQLYETQSNPEQAVKWRAKTTAPR
jgi:tetratricopeptide (TPR) repeat protein